MIYDNPHALVICHYKREKALCHRDGTRDTPSLDHCVPGCGNIARTDAQAAQLRERADALETQAQHVPQPVGDRLRAAAAKLREQGRQARPNPHHPRQGRKMTGEPDERARIGAAMDRILAGTPRAL